jgi:hypothetical protein
MNAPLSKTGSKKNLNNDGPDAPTKKDADPSSLGAAGAMASTLPTVAGTAAMGASGMAAVGASAAMAAETTATNTALSLIAQQAAMAAAALKVSNDLAEAKVSFMKTVGSMIKSAAQ